MLRVFLSDRKRPKMKNVAQRRRESHRSYFFLLLPSGWHVVAARSSRWPHVWKRPFWSAGCFTPTGFFYALCPCLIQCCCFHSAPATPGQAAEAWRQVEEETHCQFFSNTFRLTVPRRRRTLLAFFTFNGAGALWPSAACHSYTLLISAFQVFSVW